MEESILQPTVPLAVIENQVESFEINNNNNNNSTNITTNTKIIKINHYEQTRTKIKYFVVSLMIYVICMVIMSICNQAADDWAHSLPQTDHNQQQQKQQQHVTQSITKIDIESDKWIIQEQLNNNSMTNTNSNNQNNNHCEKTITITHLHHNVHHEDFGTHVAQIDIGIAMLGTPFLHEAWLPDLFCFLNFAFMIYSLWSCDVCTSGHKDDPNMSDLIWSSRIQRYRLYMHAHSIVCLMRSSTVMSTLTRISVRCAVGVYHSLSLANTNCHDMLFSGHTSLCVLSASFVLVSCYCHWTKKVIAFCLMVPGALVNILVGDHYTVDVLIAVYICVMTALLYRNSLCEAYACHVKSENNNSNNNHNNNNCSSKCHNNNDHHHHQKHKLL